MASQEPGSLNTFIPTHEATGSMVVGWSRNTKDWSINRIMELRPVTKRKGYYLTWKSEQGARVRYNDGREFAWPDGSDRPTGQDNLELFEFEDYKCNRVAPSFTMGRQSVEQADWALRDAQISVIGQQGMTLRTLKGNAALSAMNWQTNCANVDGTGGTLNGNAALLPDNQNWGNGTVTTPNIKISLFKAAISINKATMGLVTPKDLVLYMSPESATKMCESAEIQSMLAGSIYSLPNLVGGIPNQNAEWGLPPQLYGFRLEIDQTIQNDSRKGETLSQDYALGLGDAYFLTRKDRYDSEGNKTFVGPNLVDEKGETGEKANYFPTYSTLIGFFYEEFTVEARDDPWNRVVQGSVVSDFDMVVTSYKGGFQFKDCFGS